MLNTAQSRRTFLARLAALAALAPVPGLAACGGSAAPAASSAPAAAKPPPASPASAAPAKPSAAASAPASAAASAAAAATGATVVNLGLLSSVSDAGFYIAMDKGYFKEQGIEINSHSFQSAAYMVAPLSEGQLDVGGGAPSAGLGNALARGIAIKIVADKGSVPEDSSFQALMIREDLVTSGRFKGQYSDLKGLKLADTAEGNTGNVSTSFALQKGGLKWQDADHVFMGFPSMSAAFAGKSIDGALVIEPFLTQIAAKNVASVFKRTNDFYPNHQVAVVMYSPQFMNDRKQLAQDFMVAYLKALRVYNDAFFKKPRDQKAYDEVVDILAKHTPVKDKSLYAKMQMPGLDPNGSVIVKSLETDQQWYLEHGYQKAPVDVNKIVDSSFAEFAVKKLGGPYKV
jgi:NitT/TauT family transport system substrate-binding protein